MRTLILAAALMPTAALAQTDAVTGQPTIQVTGVGRVSTPPDVATLIYWVTGEGKTADEASAALAAKQSAIVAGVGGLLGAGTELTSGEVSVIETRSPACDGPGNYNNRPRLSEGDCAVTGWIASLQGRGRTTNIAKAGTAAGLAARLGARDARVESFVIGDTSAAKARATAAALADARARAEQLATGAGVRLGPIVQVSDQTNGYGEIVVGASALRAPPPPPPPAPRAPVAIDVKPRPIDTEARVYVRYAIDR